MRRLRSFHQRYTNTWKCNVLSLFYFIRRDRLIIRLHEFCNARNYCNFFQTSSSEEKDAATEYQSPITVEVSASPLKSVISWCEGKWDAETLKVTQLIGEVKMQHL